MSFRKERCNEKSDDHFKQPAAWKHFWVDQAEPAADAPIIPVGSVLTMSGAGSEMTGGSVITNTVRKLKIGKVFGERLMPKFAILNPRFTFTVPRHQMVAGIYVSLVASAPRHGQPFPSLPGLR